MRIAGLGSPIIQVELWHGVIVLSLLSILVPMGILEPYSLIAGAVFMGTNFLILGYSIRWVLTPFAGKGRVRLGVFLLVLKLVLLLGLISVFFFRIGLDAMSFALGVSCLLVAAVAHGLWYGRDYSIEVPN
jgi:hypothetical protein